MCEQDLQDSLSDKDSLNSSMSKKIVQNALEFLSEDDLGYDPILKKGKSCSFNPENKNYMKEEKELKEKESSKTQKA